MTFKASRPTDWSSKPWWKIWLMSFCCYYPPWKPTYPLKIDGWKMTFPFQMVPFSGDMFFFFFWGGGGVFQEELPEVDWCHFSDLLEVTICDWTIFDWCFFLVFWVISGLFLLIAYLWTLGWFARCQPVCWRSATGIELNYIDIWYMEVYCESYSIQE